MLDRILGKGQRRSAHLKSSAEKKSVGHPGHCQSFQVPCGDLRRAMPSSSISTSVGCRLISSPSPSSRSPASAASAAARPPPSSQRLHRNYIRHVWVSRPLASGSTPARSAAAATALTHRRRAYPT